EPSKRSTGWRPASSLTISWMLPCPLEIPTNWTAISQHLSSVRPIPDPERARRAELPAAEHWRPLGHEPQVRQALQQRAQQMRDQALREPPPGAEMTAEAIGGVAGLAAMDVETVRILVARLVAAGRRQ